MAAVEVGGDGSVKWKTVVGNFRKGSIVSRPSGDAGWEQTGIDETREGESFDINLKVPQNSQEFASALFRAAEEARAAKPGDRICFHLPIEPKNEDQIRITWNSAPPAYKAGAGKTGTARKTGKASGARRAVKPARSVKKKRR